MKKLLSLLTLLVVAISASWGQTTLFNMVVKDDAATLSVNHGSSVDLNTTDHLSSLTANCTVTVKNKRTGNGSQNFIYKDNNETHITFTHNDCVVIITLDKSLANGDKITFTGSSNNKICFTSTESRATTYGTTNKEYTITDGDGLNGKNILYIWRNSGNTYIKTLTITRTTADPSISAENVDIAATTTGGNIAFTVNNPVAGGAISATNYSEASWLTVGTETTSPISFTATANTGAERSATVRLTYTYNTNETVTKDVTITQAAATYAITYNKGAYGTGSIDAGEKSYGVDFTLSSEKFTREGYNQTGWATADGGEKAYDLGGTYTANAAIELFPVWAPLATNITVTYANGAGAEGVVPAALTGQTEGTEITLPKNFTMYKEGYTLTGWKIGEDVYAPGASYTVPAEDVTLTADYTPNEGITLANRTSATTIKWGPWNTSDVPAIVTNGEGFFVAQATVAGKTIDVKMPFDATGAKIQNQASDWTQVLPGTKFYVPSANGATISYHYYDNNVNPAVVDVTSINVDSDTDPYTLTIEAEDGNYYIEYVQVVLPKITITPEAGEIFKLNMTYSGKSAVSLDKQTEIALGSYGTATSGCDVIIGNKSTTDDGKAQIVKDKGVYFNGNDAYIKIELNFALKTNDVITFTNPDSNNRQVCFTTTNVRSETEKTVSNSYTVDEALNGATTLYVWRAATGATYAKTLTISRPITLNASGYATFSKSTDFEFSGATAYKMALDENAKTITGTAVTGKIAAGEGILFKGEANAKVSITETTGAEALTGNDLKGTTTASGKATVPTYCYTLSGNTFKKFKGTTFNDNKAYLESTQDLSGQSFEIIFDDQPTAISFVVEDDANVAVAPVKVIKNGQLFIGNYNVAGARIK